MQCFEALAGERNDLGMQGAGHCRQQQGNYYRRYRQVFIILHFYITGPVQPYMMRL
jgi:hypothetical protein